MWLAGPFSLSIVAADGGSSVNFTMKGIAPSAVCLHVMSNGERLY